MVQRQAGVLKLAVAASAALSVALAGCAGDQGVPSQAPQRSAAGTPATPSPTAQAARQKSASIYAHTAPGKIKPAWRRYPLRVYVPNSLSGTVTVINPRTYKVVGTYPVGSDPNHVTPSWDGSVLWTDDTGGNDLVPINPATGKPGKPVRVADPYNLYFTPDGRYALVVAEALNRIDFRDPGTMALRYSLHVPCAGINHLDFTAGGQRAVASCEFSAQLLEISIPRRKVIRKLTLGEPTDLHWFHRASQPQDVRLSPDGATFYVTDLTRNGVWLIDAKRFRKAGFIHTGRGAHGLLVTRDSKDLLVSNRNAGSVSVISFATRRVIRTWHIPSGGSPDMGGITPDGKVVWLSGRYDNVVYAISVRSGRLIAKVPVGAGPHGASVFPQPGRYSLGHTGNFR
jgi:YVTN family beta-propeller protein